MVSGFSRFGWQWHLVRSMFGPCTDGGLKQCILWV